MTTLNDFGRPRSRRIGVLALAAALAGMLAACTTTRLEYEMPLTEVIRQPGAQILESAADEPGRAYRDQRIQVTARARKGRFHLVLDNLGDRTARLLWEEASYVGPDSRAGEVIVQGGTGGPTVIPAGARANATVIPKALVRGGNVADFFDVAQAEGLRGTSVRLVLPFLVGEQRLEYTLVFTVRHAEVITESNYPSGHDTFLISDPEKDDEDAGY